MRMWVLYDRCDYEKNVFFADRLVKNSEVLGYTSSVVLTDSLPDEAPDAVISRTRDWRLTHSLEEKGARVFNPSEVSRICNDKHTTYQLAEELGIPTLPHSIEGQQLPEGPPWVVKSRTGHGGSQVFMAEGREELEGILQKLGSDALVQKVAPVLGRDMRAYVLDGEIISCVMRSSDKDFRANHSLGGRAELCRPSEECRRIVSKMSEALGPCFVGIDFVFGEESKAFLNEVEDVVGTRMLYELTGLDPAAILVDNVHSKMSL